MLSFLKSATAPSAADTLPDRDEVIQVTNSHYVNGNPIQAPFPEGLQSAVFGMGCFWGAERIFWQKEGVYTTAVGYAGGSTANATYQDTCSGRTGHTEAVLVVYDPDKISYADLLVAFFESHDPTQGMRQGNDIGSQYRSAIYTYDEEQLQKALEAKQAYENNLGKAGFGKITTEIRPAEDFYYAEDYHQQYLAKNPGGYCGIGGTGVSCPSA